MSLFSKLTGIDNKAVKKIPENLKLENDKEEINFFNSEETTEAEKQPRKRNNKTQPLTVDKDKKTAKNTIQWDENDYEEGELSLDVYQDKNDIIIKSTIAGVKPEDIDISVNNDMLTIRGKREHEETVDEKNYYYKECYWGNFSRSVILPCEVKTDRITAKLKNGVLMVRLPKTKMEKKIAIKVVEE